MCHHLVVECFRNLPHQQAMHFPKPLASSHKDAARNLEAAMCLGHQRSKAATTPGNKFHITDLEKPGYVGSPYSQQIRAFASETVKISSLDGWKKKRMETVK